jgi:lipid II:glycine glycyltransferase (peptidoglycan interpeptide bridge formation enzyme)
MRIRELNIEEFENFVDNHPLGNYYQSINYALLMAENGYEYELIGYVDEYNRIYAASLILIKKLSHFFKYGYAPKGFIIDYFNKKLLKEFTNDIIEYYKKKLVFIKINPEIATCEINPKTNEKEYNCNVEIKDYLIDLGYVKLKDNLYFESMIPRYNGIVNLKDFNINNLEKNTRNKIKRAEAKGLNIELADRSGIDILFDFIKKKRNKDAYYYKDYYNIFSKSNNVDLFLVSLDTNKYLLNAKESYEIELENNTKLNEELIHNQNEKNINTKMNSDRKLLSYKNDILEATRKASEASKIYIGGALVIKYKNRINFVISGFDTRYKRFNANYLLHYKILDYYKKYYDFADLNGMTGDFTKNNPYLGLNRFKLGFKPKVYEFIGEYDLVINNTIYHSMLKSGKLAKIFNKSDIKK